MQLVHSTSVISLVLGLTFAAACTTNLEEEPIASEETANRGVEEIIVTSSKRDSSLRDVPQAIGGWFFGGEPEHLPDLGSGHGPGMSGDKFDPIQENGFEPVASSPLSTFAVDVDTASYTKLRRYIEAGALPPPDAIRIEELLNYFAYEYEQPDPDQPFSVDVELARAPWESSHLIARVGIQGREPSATERRPANLVFLVDRSGSMRGEDRLDLAKAGMRMLTRTLDENDRVAIIAYAGSAQRVLRSTPGDRLGEIERAIDALESGGGTQGGKALQMAYDEVLRNYDPRAINRVVLCTDGDFNVGVTDTASLVSMVAEYADRGVSLSAFGFGVGNQNDAMMERISNRGDGNYAFVDSAREAKRVFVDGARSMLETIAKDVKIQVEFNPREVRAYRLIGYENRRLQSQDFNDDAKDAGEIGAGHQVTALYEIVPVNAESETAPDVDELRYQRTSALRGAASSGELMNVRLRYQAPGGGESRLLELPVASNPRRFRRTSHDFQFAVAVAGFGMMLRESEHMGGNNWVLIDRIAREAQGRDRGGDRREFVRLVDRARKLSRR
jgi:Ca-activated chloride channel family protein